MPCPGSGPGSPEGRDGAERARRLDEMYARLAAEHRVTFVPDLLAGVAGHEELLFRDRLHPNAAGHRRLAENVRPHLELVLAQVEAPLLEEIMAYTRNNQTKASVMLGLNRGTLRKKLKQYNLIAGKDQ